MFGVGLVILAVRKRLQALTLVELLVVLAVLAVLVLLVVSVRSGLLGGKEARARREIAAIQAGLEHYRYVYGRYPTTAVRRENDPTIDAKMLYQALTGDGTDAIFGREPVASDGEHGTEGRLLLGGSFTYTDSYLMDPWKRPYRYRRKVKAGASKRSSFDIWSEGPGAGERNGNQRKRITN